MTIQQTETTVREEQAATSMMSPPEKDEKKDEKEAVLSLLQFSDIVTRETKEQEEKSHKSSVDDLEEEEYDDTVEEEPDEDEDDSNQSVPVAQPTTPALVLPQIFVQRMGKKRKDHQTTDGQFEDAPEVFTLSGQGGGGSGMMNNNNNNNHSTGMSRPFFSQMFPQQHQQQMDPHQAAQRQYHMDQLLRAHRALQQMGPPNNSRQMMTMTESMINPQLQAAQFQAAQLLGTAQQQHSQLLAAAQNNSMSASQGQGQQATTPTTQSSPGGGHLPEGTFTSNYKNKGAFGDSSSTHSSEQPSSPSVSRVKELQTQAMIPPKTVVSALASTCVAANIDTTTKKSSSLEEEQQRKFVSTRLRYEEYTPPAAWGELAQVSKMDPVDPDDDMKDPVDSRAVNACDVLLGRGGMTNTHPGNIKFRELVAKYRMAYCTAPKGDKGALARYLCNYVRSMNGRFLTREASNGNWYEVGDEKAVSKCGQALREGTAALIRKVINDGTAGDEKPTEEEAIEVLRKTHQMNGGI
jgi:hypothetical protein